MSQLICQPPCSQPQCHLSIVFSCQHYSEESPALIPSLCFCFPPACGFYSLICKVPNFSALVARIWSFWGLPSYLFLGHEAPCPSILQCPQKVWETSKVNPDRTLVLQHLLKVETWWPKNDKDNTPLKSCHCAQQSIPLFFFRLNHMVWKKPLPGKWNLTALALASYTCLNQPINSSSMGSFPIK